MQIGIGRAGAFPAPGRARILCAHIEGEQRALAGLRVLAASVAAGARRAGAPPPDERRRYRPHVTLARSREPAHLRPLVEALSGFGGKAWNATRVDLIRSETGPRPRYQTIGSWPRAGKVATETRPDSERKKPYFIDGCKAWAADGPVVERLFPLPFRRNAR